MTYACVLRILKVPVLKPKLKRKYHLKGTLQKQSNKHQNSRKTLLKADKKNENICLPKIAV